MVTGADCIKDAIQLQVVLLSVYVLTMFYCGIFYWEIWLLVLMFKRLPLSEIYGWVVFSHHPHLLPSVTTTKIKSASSNKNTVHNLNLSFSFFRQHPTTTRFSFRLEVESQKTISAKNLKKTKVKLGAKAVPENQIY